MTEIECVMKIMEEKGYIEIRELQSSSKAIPSYIFFTTNEIKDDDIREEIWNTIQMSLEENLDYLVDGGRFCKKKDIDNYIEPLIALNQEVVERDVKLLDFMAEYIKSKYNVELPNMKLINLDVRKKRLEDEYNKDMEALELLYNIL